MKKETRWFCPCNWTYDPIVGEPSQGVKPGTAFEDLPDDFYCPRCHVDKRGFVKKDMIHDLNVVTSNITAN